MLDILDTVKQEYIDDSVQKNIIIPFMDTTTDISGVNWYIGSVNAGGYGANMNAQNVRSYTLWPYVNYDGTDWTQSLPDYVYTTYLNKATYIYLSYRLTITPYTTLCKKVSMAVGWTDTDDVEHSDTLGSIMVADYLTELSDIDTGLRLYTRIPAQNVKSIDVLKIIFENIPGSGSMDMNFTYGISRIQIESSNTLYNQPLLEDVLPYLGESIIRQGQNPLDYITIGKDPISNITNDDIEFQNFRLQENLCSSDNLKFGACESSYVNFTVYDRTDDFKGREIAPFITTDPDDIQASIPLGTYTVSEVKRTESHNLVKTEITAYDKLTLLEQNAANWYTLYMYAVNTDDYSRAYSFEFTRQIYSSYFNIMKYLGIEKRSNYDETEVAQLPDENAILDAYTNTGHKTLTYAVATSRWSVVRYPKMTISNPETSKPYVVDLTNAYGQTDDEIKALAVDYKQFVDSECRGLVGIGNVLIAETITGVSSQHCFLVDSGDYFMVSPGCTSFDVYFPMDFNNELAEHTGVYHDVTGSVKVSRVEKTIDLTNAATRLLYYGWQSRDIFPCESSITARDVVRSLLEVCGCLFRLDRYGLPTFLYPTMTALYPSNTLYPADDLYPRGANGDILPLSRYISLEYEDYQVQNIGRIQIVKKQNSSDVTSICEWEYEGNPSAKNTYLIDDNIFYCSDKMEYDYDNMGDVGQMLINMYSRIGNMKYCPHLTKALGMPWMEVGDRVGLLTNSGGIESFIYRRTLKGVQLLEDTYEADGSEYIEKIKDYNYTLWEG